eukprot:Em0001g1561a
MWKAGLHQLYCRASDTVCPCCLLDGGLVSTEIRPASNLIQLLLKDVLVQCVVCHRDVKAGYYEDHECTQSLTPGEEREAAKLLKRAISTSPDQATVQLATGGTPMIFMKLTKAGHPTTAACSRTVKTRCSEMHTARSIISGGEPSALLESEVLTLNDEEKKSQPTVSGDHLSCQAALHHTFIESREGHFVGFDEAVGYDKLGPCRLGEEGDGLVHTPALRPNVVRGVRVQFCTSCFLSRRSSSLLAYTVMRATQHTSTDELESPELGRRKRWLMFGVSLRAQVPNDIHPSRATKLGFHFLHDAMHKPQARYLGSSSGAPFSRNIPQWK